jgi:hypothetical protein
MTQVVSYRSLTAEKWVQSQVSPSWPRIHFSPRTLSFPCQNYSITALYSFILEVNSIIKQDEQWACKVILRRVRRGKGKSIAYSQRVFLTLVMQQAKRKPSFILESEVCPALPYFFALSHKIFGKQLLTINMCFDFLYNFCLKYFAFLEELSEKLS